MSDRTSSDDLREYEPDPEDEVNQNLKAGRDASEKPRGLIGAVEETIDTLVKPLERRGLRPDRSEQEAIRRENDREARTDQDDTSAHQ